jgi:hypothetical protein
LSGASGIASDRARVPRVPVEGKLHVLTAGAYISDAGIQFQQTGSRSDFTCDWPLKVEEPL